MAEKVTTTPALGFFDNLRYTIFVLSEEYLGDNFVYYLVGLWFFLAFAFGAVVFYNKKAKQGKVLAGGKPSPRTTASTALLMERYVEGGLNDDLYFSKIARAKDVNEMTTLNPFKLSEDLKTRMSSGIAERKVAFVIGCDHSTEAPYCSEDAEKMKTMYEKMGFKTTVFASRGAAPTTTAMALTLKQLKFSKRTFDAASVFVAGRCRVMELDRDLLRAAAAANENISTKKPTTSEEKKEKENTTAEEEDADPYDDMPFFILEVCTDEEKAEDPKSWVDIHMIIQRTAEAVGADADLNVILDLSLDVTGAKYLPETPETANSRKNLENANLKDLLMWAGLSRHIHMGTVGSARHVVPASTAGKRPKYQGSFFVRRLTEAFAGVASLQDDDPDADPDVSGTVDEDEPSVSFAVAHGNTKTGLFHCGSMNVETIVSHLSQHWNATVGNSQPAAGATPPFFHCPLGLPTPITLQEALMPKMWVATPTDYWKCGGQTPAVADLRKLAMQQARRGRGGEKTSFVIAAAGAGSFKEGSGGAAAEWVHRSGQGLTTFLRRFTFMQNMIRRDVAYIDLEYYAARAFDEHGPTAQTKSFPFSSLISDLGRLLCNLEHVISNDEEALRFAIRTLAGLKPIVILDHYTLSGAANHPAMQRFQKFLAADDISGEELAEGAPSPIHRRLGLILGGVEARGCNGKFSLPTSTFNPVAFCEGKLGQLTDDQKETVQKLTNSGKMDLWLWALARGHLDLVESGNPLDLLTATSGSLSKREHTVVMHLIAAAQFKKELQFEHLSVMAVALQCGYSSPWDAAGVLQSLTDRGILFYQPSYEVATKKEMRLYSLRINPAIQHVLTTAIKLPSLKAFAKDLMTVYAVRAKGIRGNVRSIYDGFFFPRIVTTLRALPIKDVEEGFTFAATSVIPGAATPSTVIRLLMECVRNRGASATIKAYTSTTIDGFAAAPLVELPGKVAQELERHRDALMTQPNEIISIIYDTLAKDNKDLLEKHFPKQLQELPMAQHTFFRNMTKFGKSEPFYAPPLLTLKLQHLTTEESDLKKKAPGNASPASCIYCEVETGRVVVGFKDGSIAVGELPQLPYPHATAVIPEDFPTAVKLNVVSAGRHSVPPDTIMAHGEDHYVTASREAHEIFLWKSDFSSFEKVEQLSRPPAKKPIVDSDDEDDSSDEEEDDENGAGHVARIKRTFFAHLTSRTISDQHLESYLRSASDDTSRRDMAAATTTAPKLAPEAKHTVMISVGAFGSRQKSHETAAPELQKFNMLQTQNIDPVKGVATVSTPDNNTFMTAAAIATHPKDGILRVITADSTGAIQVYVLRSVPSIGFT